MGKDRKASIIKARSKDLSSKGIAPFLSNVITFWLSHLAVRQIELPSILAYVIILCKLTEERGNIFAVRYHHYLQNHLLDKVRIGEKFNLDQWLSIEQDHIIRKIESRTSHPQFEHPKAPGGAKDRPAIERPPRPTRQPSKPPAPIRQARKIVCFKHRPHEGVKCSDRECHRTKEHLDTSQADQLVRFERASAAAEAKKRKASLPSNQSR